MEKGSLDDLPVDELPQVQTKSGGGRISLVWIIPLVATLVGGWLAYKTLAEQGPLVTITFRNAEGLKAGKTLIKHKDVEIGKVESVELSEDFSHVKLRARLSPSTADALTGNTKFWVVRPRMSLRGVSGLGTLLGGAYIEMEPGKGPPKKTFAGLETPPVVRADTAGVKFMLEADTLGSLEAGTPIYHRDIQVGEILHYEMNEDNKGVSIHAFVKMPHSWLVRSNTQFWRASGVDVSLDSEGFRLRTASLERLLMGGIAFNTPETLEEAPVIQDGHRFPLYTDQESIHEQGYTRKVSFVLFFNGSVRGLSIGAPVEFKGIKIGLVTDINLEYDIGKSTFRVPVLVQIEPERVREINSDGSPTGPGSDALLEELVARGLRARLTTGSFLTGQLFVELDLFPDAPILLTGGSKQYQELPTIPSSIEEITASVTDFLKKIQALPLQKMSDELVEILEGVNKSVNAPEVLDSIKSLDAALKEIDLVAKNINKDVIPTAGELTKVLKAAEKTLKQVDQTFALVDKTIAPQSPLYYNVVDSAKELRNMARSIRAFVDLLERNPQSLLLGND
ncbi:MAG: MCE family protein [Magnetococcales bacterium]|nr:MCE family protein [Magnetococcales bacterium]